jgi:hypothetical protein
MREIPIPDAVHLECMRTTNDYILLPVQCLHPTELSRMTIDDLPDHDIDFIKTTSEVNTGFQRYKYKLSKSVEQ